MEQIDVIKKHAGFLIIPLFWLAYFVDFGVSQVHDRSLDAAAQYLPPNFIFGAKVILSILLVTIALLTLYVILGFSSAHLGSHMPFTVVALVLSCFGVAGLFKQIEGVPFQSVNLFWHLGSLAAGIWLFEFISQHKN